MENRACGSARRPIRGCDRTTPQWSNAGVTRLGPTETGRGCATGLDESVVRVPPGRTGCIVLRVSIRIDSSIAGSDSRHRARSSRWNELGGEIGEFRTTRTSSTFVTEWDVAIHPSKTKAWVSAVLSNGSSSGGNQVCEYVSWAAVPRSCMGVLTRRGGSHDSAPFGLEAGRSSPVWAKHI